MDERGITERYHIIDAANKYEVDVLDDLRTAQHHLAVLNKDKEGQFYIEVEKIQEDDSQEGVKLSGVIDLDF